MKKIQLLAITLMIITGLKVNAQDIHFSQFWNSPLLINPSFAGNAEGEIRAIVNHRSQWGGVTSNPFNTFGANFDMSFDKTTKGNFFAAGLSMYTDVAGASKMRTTVVDLSAAYHIRINNQSYFAGGIQGGINQKSINESNLRFDNQFDGLGHNSGLNSNENLANLSELKPTASAGISYSWFNKANRSTTFNSGGKKRVNLGFAAHYYNPSSFYFAKQSNMGFKYIASFEGSFGVSSKWTVQPALLTAFQNKATDIVVGSLFKYMIKEESHLTDFNKGTSIAFGGYYRFQDALIPTVQIQWAAFEIGFSYDVNLSQLTRASNGRGGFEISLKYIFQSSLYGRRYK